MSSTRRKQERGLEKVLTSHEGCVREVNSCEFIDTVGGGFGASPEPFGEQLYLLFQVHLGSSCRLQVPSTRREQERDFGEILAGL